MSVTFADLFCGAGGSINGMVDAGFELVVGANHSERAIETVSTNHRNADFLCTDINHYDMRRLPHTDVLWASVICTEMSPAGGNRKHRGQGQLDLEELGHVPADAYERTRACALDVIRATEVHRYTAVIVENVVEFARDWELYDWWVEGMCKIRPGYNVQVVNVSAAHVYDEANSPAPQWRDRIYIVFTRKGVPVPDLEPRPPAWCVRCDATVDARQAWKRPDRRRVGKYGQQYLYRCGGCGDVVEPFVLPAIAALDLTDVGQRIGDRAKPLAPRTMARIQWGLDYLAFPIIATVAGNTFEAGGYKRAWPAGESPLTTRQATGCDAICGPLMVNSNHDDDRVYPAGVGPLPTRTVKIGDGVATPGFYVKNYGDMSEAKYRAHPVDVPLGSITAHDSHGLVSMVVPNRNNGRARLVDDEPVATVSTGNTQDLVQAPFLVKNYGGNAQPSHLSQPITVPLSPITTKDHHALVIPYRRTSKPKRAGDGPLHTVSTIESAGLCRPSIDIDDCHYRMLKPREHARAQRFYDDYVITGNIGEQTMQAGNAVPCNVAQWVGRQLLAALA